MNVMKTQYINGGWYLINLWWFWTPRYPIPKKNHERLKKCSIFFSSISPFLVSPYTVLIILFFFWYFALSGFVSDLLNPIWCNYIYLFHMRNCAPWVSSRYWSLFLSEWMHHSSSSYSSVLSLFTFTFQKFHTQSQACISKIPYSKQAATKQYLQSFHQAARQ